MTTDPNQNVFGMSDADCRAACGEGEHPEIAGALEEIGLADRRSAPSDLTDRIMVRTQAAIAGDAPAIVSTRPIRATRPIWRTGWARLAAGVVLIASVAVVIGSLRSGQATTTVERGVALSRVSLDLDLIDGTFWDDSLGGSIDGEIDLLIAESAMLDGEIEAEWSDLDLLGEEGAL